MLYEHTKCKKCDHINPAYKNICSECKNYLRERVVNIDLWNTIQLIIEDPQKAFKQIIFAEHKNFIFFITFFIAIKNLLFARFLSVPKLGVNGVTTSFIISLALVVLITLGLSLSFTFIQKTLYKRKNITLRFRDIYAVNSFSFIPYLFGLFFVFPVELIVLGGDIFSNNPYSFDIKPVITYILIIIEFIIILWSFYLISKSIFSISLNRIYTILVTLTYLFVWSASLYLSSTIIFNI
jgi:hypothetical protein